MNERRLCQLTLPAFLLFELARGGEDRASKAITRYISKHFGGFCNNDLRLMHKLSIRVAKVVKQINYYCANGDILSGRKMVLVAHFLTQLIFNEKDGNITDTYVEVAKRVERLIRFSVKFLQKDVAENDLEKLAISAEKLAGKVFNKFYKMI